MARIRSTVDLGGAGKGLLAEGASRWSYYHGVAAQGIEGSSDAVESYETNGDVVEGERWTPAEQSGGAEARRRGGVEEWRSVGGGDGDGSGK